MLVCERKPEETSDEWKRKCGKRETECENVEEIVGDGRAKKGGEELRWTTIM